MEKKMETIGTIGLYKGFIGFRGYVGGYILAQNQYKMSRLSCYILLGFR